MSGGGSLPVGHLATLPFKVSLAKSKGTAQVKISIDRSIPTAVEQVKGFSGTRATWWNLATWRRVILNATSEILGSRSSNCVPGHAVDSGTHSDCRIEVFVNLIRLEFRQAVDWPMNIELYLNVGLMSGRRSASFVRVPHRHADSYRKHTPTDIL
jgi:hypothetical protein